MRFILNQLDKQDYLKIIRDAIKEDLDGYGDITSKCIFDESHSSSGFIVCKEKDGAILCGINIAKCVFEEIDNTIKFEILREDSEELKNGDKICEIKGKTISILKSERVALNFLQHLTGIATLTRKFTNIASRYNVKITETRKTLPNLRVLEKYAVRCGDGYNHRFGLFDGILVKDNHIIASGNITEAVNRIKKSAPHTLKIEVEVKTKSELLEAIYSKADVIMLDNMSYDEMKDSVKIIRENLKDTCKIEASGGVKLETIEEICKTGVDIISIGAITNSAKAIDFSLELK